MHRLATLLFFLTIVIKLYAQDSTAIANTDAITYDLYMKKDWKQLIEFSKSAIDRKEDFFYLRFRLGIAYYELKKYRIALYHFEKAYRMNNNEELLREYLYYCYIYTEQYSQALKISGHFSEGTLKKTKMENPAEIFLVQAEAGEKISDNDSLYKPLIYVHAGLGFRFGRAFTSYCAYTYLTQQSYIGVLSQNQFYATLTFPMKNSYAFMPAIHFLNYTYSDITPPSKPGHSPSPPVPISTGTSYVASVSLSKNRKDFLFTGTVTYSTMNKAKQFQQQLSIDWYPLHYNKLKLNAGVILFSNDSGTVFKPVLFFGGRLAVTRKIAVTANYTRFDIKYFSEQSGYLVNNSDDITHQRIGAGVDWNCYKNISLYGLYLSESKTISALQKDYNFNVAIAGVKLIF